MRLVSGTSARQCATEVRSRNGVQHAAGEDRPCALADIRKPKQVFPDAIIERGEHFRWVVGFEAFLPIGPELFRAHLVVDEFASVRDSGAGERPSRVRLFTYSAMMYRVTNSCCLRCTHVSPFAP